MPWLIDGSNVLGIAGADRHSDEAKRALVRTLTRFARAKRTRITCVFDGEPPAGFATSLGAVSIVFSAARTADDIIVSRASHGRGWNVVTSDRALGDRIRGRHVTLVGSREFLQQAETLREDGTAAEEDWAAWFADPKNRQTF
jgi:predicted RNA-binding protein with PIN domain